MKQCQVKSELRWRQALKILWVTATLVFLSAATAYGWSDWLTLKTDHFTVFYKPGHEAQAKEVLQSLEYYRPEVEKLCGNEQFHFPIVLEDTGSEVNGFTDALQSRIHLFQTWPADGWAGIENWLSLVGVHEYTHELSLTKTSGIAAGLSRLFGKNSLWMPNSLTPGWIIEGITVYNESQLTPYEGRLNDGRFDAYMAVRVHDGRFPSLLDATYMPMEYQEESAYTFGGEFMNYLSRTYGEAKLTQFFKTNGAKLGSILDTPALSIDRSARQVFGKSFPQLWQDWQQAETQKYRDFQYEGQQLTQKGWYMPNLKVIGNKLYYQRMYPVKTGAFNAYAFMEIVERDLKTGAEKVLVSTTTGFTSNFRVQNGKLYYATSEVKPGFANASEGTYGYYAVLYQYDLERRKVKKLLADEINSFAVQPDGQVLFSKQLKTGFGSELFRLDPATGQKQLLLHSQYSIDDIASTGKRLVVSARRDWECESLYLLNLEKQEFTPLVDTPYQERGIELCGDRLFFTANYQKRNAVYCYDFGSGQVNRVTQKGGWIGNASYEPGSNQLYFTQLSSYGMDLYQKSATFEAFTLPDAPATVRPRYTLKDEQITRGKYRDNLKTLAPQCWLPVFNTDKNEYGVTISGGDAIMDFPEYSATLKYNTKKEEFSGDLTLPINFFAPFQAAVRWEKDEDEEIKQVDLAYPLVNRLNPGLSELIIGTELNGEDDYDGAEIAPYINLGFQYPKTRFNLAVKHPQSTLKNGRDRSGWVAAAELRQYLPVSEIRLAANYIDDPDNPDDDLFTEIRGYDHGLDAKKGQLLTAEYSRSLLQIWNGFWNPNLYFQDITGTLFYDQARPETGNEQSSWGLELHLETQALYSHIPIDWGGRFVRNREGENRFEIFSKTSW